MELRKFILRACAFLCTCIITGLITASCIAKPIYLNDKEIFYYIDTAEKVWYEGFCSIEEDDSITITFDLSKKEVKVAPVNTNKQSITVNFANSENSVVVNKPVVNFWECFFCYGIFHGIMVYIILYCCIFLAKEKQKKW